MKENIVAEKSYRFAVRIVKLNRYLSIEHREYVSGSTTLFQPRECFRLEHFRRYAEY
jgi:hypothetical protein